MHANNIPIMLFLRATLINAQAEWDTLHINNSMYTVSYILYAALVHCKKDSVDGTRLVPAAEVSGIGCLVTTCTCIVP